MGILEWLFGGRGKKAIVGPVAGARKPGVEWVHHRSFKTTVAGTSQENRQTLIRRSVQAGDAVRLVREPDNPYDKNAVAVFTESGDQIGYLPARVAATYAKTHDHRATVSEVTGGTRSKPNLGVVLQVEVYRRAGG